MKHLLPAFFFILSFTAQSQLLKENFASYTTGNDLNNQGGWSNNTSNPGGAGNCAGAICTNQKVTATSLSFANYGTSAKSIIADPGRDGIGKGWTTNVTSGSLYAAFVANFSDVFCSGTCSNEFGFFRLVDRSGNFSFVLRIYAKKASASTYQVGVEKGSSNNRVYSTLAYNMNAANLIVLKYTINSSSGSDDVVRVYINPDMSQAEPASADINTNLGNDLSTTIDIAAVQYNFNSPGILPAGNYSLLAVATQWGQLPFTAAAVNTIDRDIQTVKVFSISASQAILQMNSNKTDALTIEVTDITGRMVAQQKVKLQPGANQFRIETAKLAGGIYNVKAFGSKGVTPTVRFIKN
jgi:hypothetical protein